MGEEPGIRDGERRRRCRTLRRRRDTIRRLLPLLLAVALWADAAAADTAPFARDDFTLHEADGDGTFELLRHRGQYVALHFLLKTTCPYCIQHTHDYANRADEVPNTVHLFIKPDTDEEIAAWSMRLQGQFEGDTADNLPTIWRDPDARLAELFDIPDGYQFHGQVVHYPALVILDPEGNEVFRYVGANNGDRLSFDDFTTTMTELTSTPRREKPKMADDFPWPEERIERYTAYRADGPITVDGHLDEASWKVAPRSPRFSDLVNGTPGIHDTRAAVLWDDDYLYVGYWVEEPFLEATLTERDSPIYTNNDVEFFVAGPDGYYEFEINTFGTIYEVFFLWEEIYETKGYDRIPEFSREPELVRPFHGVGFQPHPRGPRIGYWNWDFPGLKTAVVADGTINDNSDRDRGWTVELAFPWEGMKWIAHGDGRAVPPADGDTWRMDFSRFNTYKQAPPADDHGGWAWSPHGTWDSHVPEVYPYITFSSKPVGEAK